jgi:lysophospholipase L1-like esterase
LRGDEPPADWKGFRTIVTIGGSTTQCFYLDDAKTWPYQLQLKLQNRGIRAWVGNAGVSGHSTRAHLLFVREILPKIHPEIAMILCGINDLWYSLDDHSKTIETTPENIGWKHRVLGYSRLVQVLFLWKIILWDKTVVLERAGNSNFLPTPINNELVLNGKPEKILPSIISYRANLISLIQELQRQQIRPVFVTQPVLYDTTSYWKRLVGWQYNFNNRKGELSAATYASMVFRFNETLRNVCREQHVELIDAEKEIPHTTEYFYDLMHFTERGAERLAEYIASRIMQCSEEG